MTRETIKVLFALGKAGVELHLTGSHYFGTANEHSDLDFFCSEAEEGKVFRCNFEQLESTKYKNLGNATDYKDDETLAVYTHLTANIHIQIVKDVSKKIAMQDFLKSAPYSLLCQDKAFQNSVNQKWWNWAATIVEQSNDWQKPHPWENIRPIENVL